MVSTDDDNFEWLISMYANIQDHTQYNKSYHELYIHEHNKIHQKEMLVAWNSNAIKWKNGKNGVRFTTSMPSNSEGGGDHISRGRKHWGEDEMKTI